jgi:hypothetical protein
MLTALILKFFHKVKMWTKLIVGADSIDDDISFERFLEIKND